jgi:hypothetical protein
VLLIPSEKGLTLPHFNSPGPDFATPAYVNHMVNNLLGLPVVVRRCIHHEGAYFYVMDNLGPESAGMVWLSRSQLDSVTLAHPEHRAIIHDCFDWEAESHPLRAAWSQQGWFKLANEWIADQLDRLGLTPTGPLLQERVWSRGCVLHVDTDGGPIYLKAVAQPFSHEPVITRIIGQRHRGHAPDVLVVSAGESWMLMRGFRGQPLEVLRDTRIWEQTLAAYARIQVDMIPHAHSLISLGCPDRNVDSLAAGIDYLLSDLPAGLHDAEIEELTRLAPILRTLCYDLIDCGIPLTLEHGDFRPTNIVIQDAKPVYFDWSDSAISHPFFDFAHFLSHTEPDMHEPLRAAYLLRWQSFQTEEKLHQACLLAEPLSLLHRAMVYQTAILPPLEPRIRREEADTVPRLLRQLLQLMRLRVAQ